jgi:hypothetical protein
MTNPDTKIKEGCIIAGSLFNEPMRVETVRIANDGNWTVGLVGTQSELFRKVSLTAVRSIWEAMERRHAPFYLRRTKEAMVYFPERRPDGTWTAEKIFTKRIHHTVDFLIDGPELDLYKEITRYVKRQSAKAAATGTILLTPNERRVPEDRRNCYWLYSVTNCALKPVLQEPIKDPARFHWQEVTKVAHYRLEVNAMTKPMKVREDVALYGEKKI